MLRSAFSSGRKSLLLLALIAAVIGGAWWWQRPPPEPVYHGQRLSEWLAGFVADGNHPQWKRETTELHAFGLTAIPWLTYMLEHGRRQYGPGPWPFEKAPDWLRRWAPERWGGLRVSPPFDEREVSAQALDRFGPEAAPAIPALVRSLMSHDEDADRNLYAYSAETLYAIGPAAWPAIFDALEHERTFGPLARSYLIGYPAVEKMQVLETDLPRGAAILVKACHESDPDLLEKAVKTIGFLRRDRPDTTLLDAAIPDLIRILSADDSDLMVDAAGALAAFGPRVADPAIPRLIERLDDPSTKMRSSAARSLGYIDTTEKRSAARLRAMLHDPDAKCREAAAKTLEWFGLWLDEGSASPEAVPAR